MENHYERLGVHPAAHPDVIRAAYRALAKLYHPDNGSSAHAERMKEVNEAWAVLSDPQRRTQYNADLRRSQAAEPGSNDDRTSGGAEPTMGSTGWGEAAKPAQPPPPPHPTHTPPPRWNAPPPQRTPAPPRQAAHPFAPNPSAVAGRRVLAAVLDGILVGLIAGFSWQIFVTATYDTVEATATTPDCAALSETVRDCEEIGGTLYVSDATSSLVIEWLTWGIPIVAVHVTLQTLTGATVGKHVLGLRTVGKNGLPPTLTMNCVRTALAAVDLFPYCFPAVGFWLVMRTRRQQRLGDMAARTFVVTRAAAGQPVTVPAG
jgi:uncharacterized RDD family membrane protein YckC